MEKQNTPNNEVVKIDSNTFDDNPDVENGLRTYDQVSDKPEGDHGAHLLYDSVSSQAMIFDVAHTVVNEDQFEAVSLMDDKILSDSQAICKDSMQTSDDKDNNSPVLSGLLEIVDPFRDHEMQTEHGSSPGKQIHYNINQYTSNNSESGMYTYGGCSPVGSPLKPRTKPSMPDVSPDLLHLVDSAIMGKPDSLEKLKNVVSGIEIFKNMEDETENIALLVVDSLLATMGGVESFDEDEGSNPPSVMLNSRAAIVAAELIPWLPCIGDFEGVMSPRTRMVRGLLAILRACTRNRSMCSIAGLLGVLLTSAERVFVKENNNMKRWDGTPLCQCICHLSGHSLSPVDLRKWFLVISRTHNTVWGTHMMLTLEKAIGGKESKGPACTFEFDGESSGLLGPGESRWPFSNGYAFATWIYVESFADTLNAATAAATIAAAAAKSGKSSAMSAAAAASALAGEGTVHMPRLFSFLTSDNQGVEAYFHAQFLVVESGMGKGKKFSLHFTHVFKPQCWYFIGLEHVVKPGLIGKSESELRLYIDGSLYESRQFEFPRISKPLAFCCIGTNPPPTIAGLQRRRRQCPLFAEIGPIYIFKEPIGPENMGCLASRGGDAVPYFGNGAGHPWLSTNDYMRIMTEESIHLDSELSAHIHLIYHPKLLNGRFCPDASPSGASGIIRRPAEVLGQVHIAIRMRPVEALWALAYGGPMCLLPFSVRNMNKESLEPEQGGLPLCVATASLMAPIFRIISVCIQYPANSDELAQIRGPEVLSRTLSYFLETLSSLDVGIRGGIGEELVVAVVSLCQSEKINHSLKVQLFSNLLLDIKIWSSCDYGIQKKLLSSLSDMVFTELTVMRDANAIQMLLDGCRRCYWWVREPDSTPCFSVTEKSHNIGEVNALVDELFVVVELLVGAASPSLARDDVACLLRFMVDNPQPNQVTRVLSLLYRLVAQPNTSRAHKFAKEFILHGGIETLLVLLQRESKAGDFGCQESSDTFTEDIVDTQMRSSDFIENGKVEDVFSSEEKESVSKEEGYESSSPSAGGGDSVSGILHSNSERTMSASESFFLKHFSAKSFSISSDNARNNVYNVDESDGIVVGIISLIGALISLGYLNVGSHPSPDLENFSGLGLYGEGNPMYDDKISLLLFALQKVFQAAPRRLMTMNAYTSLLTASINVSLAAGDGLNFYDSGHRFEHFNILNVLLHSLPNASVSFQCRAIQDLLFLVCSHPENRSNFTKMEAWPEWILEVLISNYETENSKGCTGSLGDIEDIAHSFLIIMLEHSMRQKDGWKDVEATIHCAEWLSMVGGSSSRGRRARREESLPIFKRRLLGGLLDFSTRELRVQTQVIAAASAGVAAEGLSPKESKVEAENAAQLSVALVENSIVILMLVEDHLRLQSKLSTSSRSKNSTTYLMSLARESSYFGGKQSTNEAGGLSLDILASMADENGQLSTAVMERLTAAAAAEPYESVSCAFVSYGSCTIDQAKGWEYRSRLWYGVSHPTKTDVFGGGGSGWESWNSILEKDGNGDWIELPLIKKSVAMLQALLLDESGLGGGLGIGGGSGTGMGGMAALYQLLDSDQPFMCMLRMTLASMREEDNGDDSLLPKNSSVEDGAWNSRLSRGFISSVAFSAHKSPSALLWSVLSPLLNMPVLESKRQRVLVASCILYSEVWHAVSTDRKPLRKRYLEAFLPPFVALLRRWRPLLAGIHELATSEGFNPLVVDGRALAADALPIEASLDMISPEWAAAFASPPAAMALAMIAAGAAGADTSTSRTNSHLRRESSLLERRTTKLNTFSSFQKQLEGHSSNKSFHFPKDKAAAKAAALAAARDLERNAKIGSGRGLSAIAMATSSQRRSISDTERVKRWNDSEAMGAAWTECLQSDDTKSMFGNDYGALSYKFVAVLVTSFALARNMKRAEIDRRTQADVLTRHRICTGVWMWRKLIHCLEEMDCLFGTCAEQLRNDRVFWKLDFMESSSRMRQCLKRNYKGSYHEGAAANCDDDITHGNVLDNVMSSSNNSILTAEAISADPMNEDDDQIEYGNSEGRSHVKDQLINNRSVSILEKPLGASDGLENSLVINDQDPNMAPSVVSPRHVPIEVDERIIIELSSSMIRPLRVVHGTFQVTTKRINFLVVESEQNSIADQIADPKRHEKNRSWLISSVHQIYSRRFLLRRSGLELFMVDRSNFFFDFGSVEGRRNAYKAIVQAHPPHLNNIYLATQKPELLLKRTQLMERWARWEISNFEYLMQLNTLAGRSYNDITQYPVFPWILSDYSSKSLNLDDPSSFRDLSKPVGALDAERLKQFQERYSSFDDPVIPKFHYGSHYSTAGTVLYYLVRVEPFSTLSIQLQGGKFDHADRMFSDIGATWKGVLEDMSDVKELVPELFYLPEVLTNENCIYFGTTQLGETLDFVSLPPWAENPVDFIHKHKMALESEHVSSHLNEWIDLIFGYKQRGKEAQLANNVFFYITYEGAVNIDKIHDPVQQRATQDQIAYFGQTPSQLLTTPHLKKLPLSEVLHLQTIFRNPRAVKAYAVPSPELCNLPAAVIHASSDTIVVADTNAPAAHVASHKWQPNTPDGHGMPFLFQHGKPASSSGGGTFLRMFKGSASSPLESHFPQAVAFACSGIRNTTIVSVTADKEIITGGHVDNSIRLLSPDDAKTIEVALGHCAPVTCLAISPDSSYLVTGSRDTTLILWRIRLLTSSSSFAGGPPTVSVTPASTGGSNTIMNMNISPDKGHRPRIEGPVHILRGHIGEIRCCCIDSDLGIVASSSESSGVLLHSIKKGCLIRKLGGVEAHSVSLSSQGVILTWNKEAGRLDTLTLNGIRISTMNVPDYGSVGCMEISLDGRYALVGLNSSVETSLGRLKNADPDDIYDTTTGSDENHATDMMDIHVPSICFLDLHKLEVVHVMELGEEQDITSFALNKDNTNLLVSTSDKQLMVVTDPTLSLKVVNQMLKLGWEGDGLSPLIK